MADINVAEANDFKQYIAVMIDGEQYGIDINYIDNIVRMQRITRVPKAQEYFAGVINLRGEVVPVMSLRLKFGLEADSYGPKSRILIIKPEAQASIGFIVDEVLEVVTIADKNIDHVSDVEEKSYVIGVGKHLKGLVSILNINAVLAEKEANS
ncbi:MAG: chemotaxis protein CheW [Lachnospiraceae bacterium]|nr:chemotaxis protein CheW [Lachnospiraceae bacterium]